MRRMDVRRVLRDRRHLRYLLQNRRSGFGALVRATRKPCSPEAPLRWGPWRSIAASELFLDVDLVDWHGDPIGDELATGDDPDDRRPIEHGRVGFLAAR